MGKTQLDGYVERLMRETGDWARKHPLNSRDAPPSGRSPFRRCDPLRPWAGAGVRLVSLRELRAWRGMLDPRVMGERPTGMTALRISLASPPDRQVKELYSR